MKKYNISTTELSKILNISVQDIYDLIKQNKIQAVKTDNGYKFKLDDIQGYLKNNNIIIQNKVNLPVQNIINVNNIIQKVYIKSSMSMNELADDSINLIITSPPYFNAKTYSYQDNVQDLASVNNYQQWKHKIRIVWEQCYRVLQPGRKMFINIMNLPIKLQSGKYKTLNLAGHTIDICQEIGFLFKRDIIWQKTNGVKSPFGSYPYPGGILINNMHEFILEFDKPEKKDYNKYAHLSKVQKEQSKLDKEFWLTIKKSDVWVMKPQASGDNRNHIAPFPYELPYRLIKAFSYKGETVLDPFVGSGVTLLAAADLKRNGIGYEINPKIAELMIEMLKN